MSARDEGAAGAGGALANVGLRRLLFAFAALTLAEWAFVTALSIHAYRVGATLAVGFVGFRFALGAVSTALLAPHVDRRPDVLSRIALVRTLLLGAAAVERWPADAIVVREGDEGTAFYVVLAGRARASIAGSAVSELHPGDSFGEIALLHAVPRTATIRAIEALTTCRIAADDFLAATSQPSTEPERASDAPS